MPKPVRILIVLVILAAIGWLAWPTLQSMITPEKNSNLLFSSGIVEATEVNIGSELTGSISQLMVDEGDNLAEGDLVARINSDELLIQLEGARANVERARSLLADTRKGLRPQEIEQLEQVVRLKAAVYDQAKIDYERKRALADKDIAPRNPAVLAEKAMVAAEQDLERARQQITIARMGARADQIAAAEAAVRQADATVAQLERRLSDAEILSPVTGTVTIKHKQAGEIITLGSSLVTVVDLKRPWVRIYIPENYLGRVRLGQTVEISNDSYPEKMYTGVLRYISDEAEFTPKNIQTQEERVKLVYAAKVYMDNEHGEFRPGMPVDVLIHLDAGQEMDNASRD